MTTSTDPQSRAPERTAGRLLVIEPMSSGLTLLGAARDLGMSTVVFSHDAKDRVVPQAPRAEIDTFVVVDTNDRNSLTRAAAHAHAEAPISGVVSGSEFYVDAAARIADELGLPGLSVETAAAVRDKTLMRAMLEKAGVQVPRYAAIDSARELEAAAQRVGFPSVLKPAAGSGSIQVTRVTTMAELSDAYRRLETNAQYVFDQPEDGRALLEQYLNGPEYSVEGYVVRGGVRVLSITRKLLGAEPYFVELGHVVQADLPEADQARTTAYIGEVVEALGIGLGAFHAEVRLTATGPVLIEIGARLAGDRIAELVTLATGVSLRHLVVAAHTGQDAERAAKRAEPAARYAAVHFFTAPGLERLSRIEGVAEAERRPHVVEVRMYLGPGDEVPAARDLRCRLGHAIFLGDTADMVETRREELAATVRFS